MFSDVDFVPLFLGTRTKLMIGADWGGNIDAVFFRYKWVGVLSSKLIMECEAEETVEDRASADEQRVGGGGKVGRMLIGVGHMWMGWLPAVFFKCFVQQDRVGADEQSWWGRQSRKDAHFGDR